jgi:hypothetical protein
MIFISSHVLADSSRSLPTGLGRTIMRCILLALAVLSLVNVYRARKFYWFGLSPQPMSAWLRRVLLVLAGLLVIWGVLAFWNK